MRKHVQVGGWTINDLSGEPDAQMLPRPGTPAVFPSSEGINRLSPEKIRAGADRCLSQWWQHFERFYQVTLDGDREKKHGVIMGIESMRDELIRELEQE